MEYLLPLYGDFVNVFGLVKKNLLGWVRLDRTVCGDRRGWVRINAGTGGDGCEVCADGWGWAKIQSQCTSTLGNLDLIYRI